MHADKPEATPSSVLDVLTQVFRGSASFAAAICEGFDLGRTDDLTETEVLRKPAGARKALLRGGGGPLSNLRVVWMPKRILFAERSSLRQE